MKGFGSHGEQKGRATACGGGRVGGRRAFRMHEMRTDLQAEEKEPVRWKRKETGDTGGAEHGPRD